MTDRCDQKPTCAESGRIAGERIEELEAERDRARVDRAIWHTRWQQLMRDYEEAVRQRDGLESQGDSDYKTIQDLSAENDRLAATVERAEKALDAMAAVPDYTRTEYDRGRVDQRHQDETDLRAAIKGSKE